MLIVNELKKKFVRYDSNNKRIAEILYNPGNYFSIEINNKSYELTNIDKESLNIILSK